MKRPIPGQKKAPTETVDAQGSRRRNKPDSVTHNEVVSCNHSSREPIAKLLERFLEPLCEKQAGLYSCFWWGLQRAFALRQRG